jgi:hypothetical protein
MQGNSERHAGPVRTRGSKGKISPTALISLVTAPVIAIAVVVVVARNMGGGTTIVAPTYRPKATMELRWSETNFLNSDDRRAVEGVVEGVQGDQLFIRAARESLGWAAIKSELGHWPPKLPGMTGGVNTYSIELTSLGGETLALQVDRILLSAAGTDVLLRVSLSRGEPPSTKMFPAVSLEGWSRDVAASPEGLQSLQPDDVH